MQRLGNWMEYLHRDFERMREGNKLTEELIDRSKERIHGSLKLLNETRTIGHYEPSKE